MGIRYIKGTKSFDHYETIIENVLKLPINEIAGLGDVGNKRFMLKISSYPRYQKLCRDFVGQTISLDDKHVIQVDDLSSYKDRVRVTNVPFELHNHVLQKLLSRYGKVENIIICMIRNGKLSGIMTMERIVWMVVNEPIPSSLYVNETQSFLYFEYEKQIPTCRRCGDPEHLSLECPVFKEVRPEKRDNAVSLNLSDFPDTLNKKGTDPEVQPQQHTEEIPITIGDADMDIHIESSQRTNEFVCPDCDYKCGYKDIMEIHMKTHTGEKTFQYSQPPDTLDKAGSDLGFQPQQLTGKTDPAHVREGKIQESPLLN